MTSDQATSETDIELLSFALRDQEYCVDIMSVREIRRWTHATSLPHSPAYVRGVINLRGTVLPVIDLGRRLGLAPAEAAERNVIIVVSVGGRTFGLLVDAVSDILSIPAGDLAPPPDIADSSQSFVNGLTIVDDRMIRVLDLGAVVPDLDHAA